MGPLFVSIGDAEKLQIFLQLNRNIPRNRAFVDNNELEAYNLAGLGSMELGQEMPEDFEVAAPQLGGVWSWWRYVTNVMELSPVEPGSRRFPEGVKRLGGTFVIDGDEIIYEWHDRAPGDTPDVKDVMKVVTRAPRRRRNVTTRQLSKKSGANDGLSPTDSANMSNSTATIEEQRPRRRGDRLIATLRFRRRPRSQAARRRSDRSQNTRDGLRSRNEAVPTTPEKKRRSLSRPLGRRKLAAKE